MEENDNIDELITHYIQNVNKRHSGKRVVSTEEISKIVSEQTGVDKEFVDSVFNNYIQTLEKMYRENPRAAREFIKNRYGAELEKFDT